MDIPRLLRNLLFWVVCVGNPFLAPAAENENPSATEGDRADLMAYNPVIPPKVRSDFDLPQLQIRGFGHFQFDFEDKEVRNTAGNLTSSDSTNNFALGGVDLFITSQISRSLSFLNETVFEFGEEGQNILDVERVLLKYEHAPWLNISGGRGHTALGYWNQRYHHGTWLYTTTDRPLLYRFEDDGGILPVHFVGVELSGEIFLDAGTLSYAGNIANGRGKITDSVQLIEDANDEKQLSAMFTFLPDLLPGLGLGANVLFDVIPADSSTAGRESEIDETIAGLHLFYLDDSIEFIFEYQHIHHNFTLEKDHSGGYAQFAFSLDKIKPYYRFDFLRIQSGDPFFTGLDGVEDSDQHTVGVRYEWFPFAAIKLEYRHLDGEFTDSNAVTAQVSFAF